MSDSNNTTVDLRDLLDKPGTDFPDRPNLPGGRYFYGRLIGIEAGHSKNKQTPLFHFDVRLTDAGKDVLSEEMEKVTSAGYSLADFRCGRDFYLTPNAMPMLWGFLESLGFQRTSGLRDTLSLDRDGLPTSATVDKIRGRDVLIKTPPADDRGRVFINNVDSIAGIQR